MCTQRLLQRFFLVGLSLWVLFGCLVIPTKPMSPDNRPTATSSPLIQSSNIPVDFELQHALAGWRRFVDPIGRYTIWLPPDWVTEVRPGFDNAAGTYAYHPSEGSADVLTVDYIEPVDFRLDPRDPLIRDYKSVYPNSTYSLTVGTLSVPCARYIAISLIKINHVCVIGPHKTYYYAIEMSTTPTRELEMLTAFRSMAASFALEQPLDDKAK